MVCTLVEINEADQDLAAVEVKILVLFIETPLQAR